MTETLIALLLAHALADFVFQTRWIASSKTQTLPLVLHIVFVFGLSVVALGGAVAIAGAVALIHLIIDWAKARFFGEGLGPFMADQFVHGASLVAMAAIWPGAFASGLWAGVLSPEDTQRLLDGMLVAAGLILAVRMGQFGVGKLMAPFAKSLGPETGEDGAAGLPHAGTQIGMLERGLTFILIVAGEPTAVGLLIAAKSFLRMGSIEKNRALAEYVIIGTLASIGWALVVGLLVRLALMA